MSENRKESFFWTSYSDLMTSLFFVMLVLFVLAIALMHHKMRATQRELDKIHQVENATQNINKDYFEFRPEFDKHVLKIRVQFPVESADISVLPDYTRDSLLQAGEIINDFLVSQKNDNPNIQFQLIIEGQASKDDYDSYSAFDKKLQRNAAKYDEADKMTGVQVSKSLSDYNYQLSYERAKALARFWLNSNVLSEVGNYDLQIVGSGDGMMTATGNMRETDELSNQRFLICIIPKIGSIEKGE